MDIFKEFIGEVRQIVRNEVQQVVQELVSEHLSDRWMDKRQLAEYWGVSTKWIDKKIDEIPKSETLPWRFKRSEVDVWRKGQKDMQDELTNRRVSINKYNSNKFKIT